MAKKYKVTVYKDDGSKVVHETDDADVEYGLGQLPFEAPDVTSTHTEINEK